MKKRHVSLAFIFSFLLLLQAAISQPGSLDNSFGNNGILVSPQTPDEEQAYKVAVQSDNKIVVAGHISIGSLQDFLIVRYLPNGAPDPSFGTNGIVTFDAGTDSDAAWDMVIQEDGKILLGGNVYNQNTTLDDFALLRFNADGTPDGSFGNGGFVSTDIEEKWDNVYAMALQDDGKILLTGESYSVDHRRACVCRYNTDGSLDTDFSSGGFALFSVGTINDHTRDIAIQEDGKYIIAGYTEDVSDQAFIARIKTDGNMDNDFGNNGIATLDVGGMDDRFLAVVICPDGKIIAGGMNGEPGNWDYLFAKYNPDGTLDNAFGSNGLVMLDFSINDMVLDMCLQDDGKLLSAGGAFLFELLRLNENGYPDLEFGNDGLSNTGFEEGISFCRSLALQNDGKVLLAGHVRNPDEYDLALCRYFLEENGLVEDIALNISSLSVFPNPASKSLTIKYTLMNSDELGIELMNNKGQLLETILPVQYRNKGKYSEKITLSSRLSPGIYYLIIQVKGRSVGQKIILK